MLTREQLIQTCKNSHVTCLRCEQGYEDTEKDVLSDNPDFKDSPEGLEDIELKQAVMYRMLEENLDYGPLMETEDEDDRDDHSKRMEARSDICTKIAENWVNGHYEGPTMELQFAQITCDLLVGKWYGGNLLGDLVDEIMSRDIKITEERVAEYIGRSRIVEMFYTSSANTVDEFVDIVSVGLSGTPLDGSPFGMAEAESFAREYWNSRK